MEWTNTLDAQPTARKQVWRIADGESLGQEIAMVLEEPLALHINGKQVAVLMRLPGMEKELAAGFCLSEGLVSRFADVLTIHHCGQGLPSPLEDPSDGAPESRHRVDLWVRPEALREGARLEVVRLIRAGCGAVGVDDAALSLPIVQSGLQVSSKVLLGLDKAMRAGQRLHQEVGGVHAAALFEASGELVALAEDIGRHNAVDKVVGYCLLRDIPLANKLLLSSGRLSYEMAAKAIRLGIPILASVSAPTALAVQLAERFGLTLIGYLRGRKMTVYAHPERIVP